jgi:hypothetical protein
MRADSVKQKTRGIRKGHTNSCYQAFLQLSEILHLTTFESHGMMTMSGFGSILKYLLEMLPWRIRKINAT